MMTIAKITAGDGYLYLIRQTARGDSQSAGERDATAYYTAQGNPPGRWIGRGAPLLGLAGKEVTEEQMRALFGHGSHPDADAIIDAYLTARVRAGMSKEQLERVADEAIAAARLGRAFPAYETLEKFDIRVAARLAIIREEAGREPTGAEASKVKAEEARRQRAAVAGFDLVFSPVKSAALLWAIDERAHVRDAIRDAHEAALADALALLEDHAALTRIGTGGIAQVQTGGLIAAAFEHWDSRAGDPNLHTHVAVSSKVQGADGKWRSLDARALYRMTVAASEAYNTGFEAHLSARLGVTFTARPDTVGGREPVREITGVPHQMVEFFSRRRAAIETRFADLAREYRARHGHDPDAATCHRLARQATLDTRQGKKPPLTLADKRATWRAELTARFGSRAVPVLMAAVPDGGSPAACTAVLSGEDLKRYAERTVAVVSARRSTWTVWNVRAEAERVLRCEIPSLPPDRHREITDKVTELALSPSLSLTVEAPGLLDEPSELRRTDGESVFTQHAAGRYTSQGVLDAEQRLVNATRTPTAVGLSGPAVAAALDGFEAVTSTRLDAGQRQLVTMFASDSRLLLAGIGPAGSGKTTAMRALAYALRQGGQHLIPLATSAVSADVLGRELAVRAENLHKFMYEWTRGQFAARLQAGAPVPDYARPFRLGPGDVVLVDEAGMAGTFMLDQLVTITSSRGAVVRLLGDDRQLPAVEGGGALRLVASQPGTPLLTTLYRFRDPGEAVATLQLRTGDTAAVDWYARAARVRSGSREAMLAAAYNGWRDDMLAGKVTLMAAADGCDVTELSARARADRVLAGQVEGDGVRLRDGNLAGAGDWIATRLNDRRLPTFGGRDWVKNGDAWHVERRLGDGSLEVRHLPHGGRVTLPASYVRDQVQLLYAVTAHRVQGATVDTAHPLVTAGMTREKLYVLATRARESTIFYVATHDLSFDEDTRADQVRHDPRAYAAREMLLNILGTEGAPLPATETIAVAQEEAGSLATLVPRYLHAAHQYADDRYRSAAIEALGKNGGRDLVSEPAWGAIVCRLYDAESNGWEPARLLATVAALRELGSADSVAEVIAWRIDGFLADNPGPSAPAISTSSSSAPASAAAPASALRPYESGATACERLAGITAEAIGPRLAARAVSETAWPALIAALRRAESAGYDPAIALSSVASARELQTARSVSEILAWRIGRHLAAHAVAEPDSPAPARLLPWLANRQAGTADNGNAQLDVYLQDAVALIATRVRYLAETAVRHRPPWMSLLGQPPADRERACEWQRHVGVIAGYRDQHKITTDDPWQILGPYPEPGHAGHTAYWRAAESVLAARHLTGLEPGGEASPDGPARATLAADVYRALPDGEREAIAALIAAEPGAVWLGDTTRPDQHVAAHPLYARQMITVLARHGYLSEGGLELRRERPEFSNEPVEAAFARRDRTQSGTAAHARRTGAVPRAGSTADRGLRPAIPPQHTIPAPYPTPIR